MIPFLDVGAAYRELKAELDSAIHEVLDSGRFILGSEVEAFEADWAAYCDTRYSVGVGNGLDALVIALRALDIGPGDEVIVPSNTFIATWLAVSTVGARPVPVEPGPDNYSIDPQRIEEAITSATKVLLPVHLYGQPADLDPILDIAKQYGLRVVEDAAQSHGARYKNRRIGGHGDVVCWSFFPSKNLGALGDAGAVTTNDADIADRVRILRNYGSREKYVNEELGVNSRLDPIQAAVLRTKLRHLDSWTDRRRSIANIYTRGLEGTGLVLPSIPEWAEPVWHLYVVRSEEREVLQSRLTAAGVGTLIHYPIPPHLQPAYRSLHRAEQDLPLAELFSRQVLSLPMGPQLSAAAVARVVQAVQAATS